MPATSSSVLIVIVIGGLSHPARKIAGFHRGGHEALRAFFHSFALPA